MAFVEFAYSGLPFFQLRPTFDLLRAIFEKAAKQSPITAKSWSSDFRDDLQTVIAHIEKYADGSPSTARTFLSFLGERARDAFNAIPGVYISSEDAAFFSHVASFKRG